MYLHDLRFCLFLRRPTLILRVVFHDEALCDRSVPFQGLHKFQSRISSKREFVKILEEGDSVLKKKKFIITFQRKKKEQEEKREKSKRILYSRIPFVE